MLDTTALDSREELRELQSERLRETVKCVYENISLYLERLDDAGVSPSDIENM